MLDVHAPHETIHGWRDFLLHLATITVGLLIALNLEAGVEALHHRHIVREARAQILEEIESNQKVLSGDRQFLDASTRSLRQDLVILNRLKNHSGPVKPSDFDFRHSAWNSPQAAAWQTARDSGALALMPYDVTQYLTVTYDQQAIVLDHAFVYLDHYHAAAIPLEINPDVTTLSPAEIDEMAHGVATALADIQHLEQLMTDLDRNYSGILSYLSPR